MMYHKSSDRKTVSVIYLTNSYESVGKLNDSGVVVLDRGGHSPGIEIDS